MPRYCLHKENASSTHTHTHTGMGRSDWAFTSPTTIGPYFSQKLHNVWFRYIQYRSFTSLYLYEYY